jgi:hypothetical protein
VVRETAQVSPRIHAQVAANQMTEDKVSVDRKTLLTVLVQVENALEEVKQLRKEIKK